MNLKFSVIQIHSIVGNINNNINNLKNCYLQALSREPDLDLVIAGELVLSGYISLDELYKQKYLKVIQNAINDLREFTKQYKATLIFSDIYLDENNGLYNAVYVIHNNNIINIIKKQKLVDYDVFNESRYFLKGENVNNIIEIKGFKLAVVVCEDLWHEDIVTSLVNKNINSVISVNASPYDKTKFNNRLKVVQNAVSKLAVPVIYVNIVGGIDGVVFDGQSFIVNKELTIIKKLAFAEEDIQYFKLTPTNEILLTNNSIDESSIEANTIEEQKSKTSSSNNLLEDFYKIIQVGLKDFINDNDINGVIIGLSGGIDSALSATIAADTLGSDKVIAVSIPSEYTSNLSKQIIEELVVNLNIQLYTIPLNDLLDVYKCNKQFLSSLSSNKNIVWENLQSRIRGNILMAISNSYNGYIVLCNGNKSELATGYFTLYGDSCGAFNLLKDLYKTEVFYLAHWRNNNYSKFSKVQKLNIIPESCITRPPSAELNYNQLDEKELLPYNKLDSILEDFIEYNINYEGLINRYSKKDVDFVLKLLKTTEYKRKQSVIGIKLKNKSFGKEWQYPITNGFKYNDYNN